MGWYVDNRDGLIYSTNTERNGYRVEIVNKNNFKEVWVIADKTDEVVEEAVYWENLNSLIKLLTT